MQPTRHPPSQRLMAFPRRLPNKLQPQPPPHHGTYGESALKKQIAPSNPEQPGETTGFRFRFSLSFPQEMMRLPYHR